MYKAVTVLVLVLMLISCSKGAEVENKINYLDEDQILTPPEDIVEEPAIEDEIEDLEAEDTDSEETDKLPEQRPPEGVQTGECTEDSKGVVRVFHDDGSKTVYRHDCYKGMLTKYRCEEGKIKKKIIACSSGKCLQGPYGDKCLL